MIDGYREKAQLILSENEEARNSDWSFVFSFLKSSGVDIPNNIVSSVVSNAELNINSMLRERQYVQNKMGLYPPTDPAVIERRKVRQKQFTEKYKQ